jgi:hypothetical protein
VGNAHGSINGYHRHAEGVQFNSTVSGSVKLFAFRSGGVANRLLNSSPAGTIGAWLCRVHVSPMQAHRQERSSDWSAVGPMRMFGYNGPYQVGTEINADQCKLKGNYVIDLC